MNSTECYPSEESNNDATDEAGQGGYQSDRSGLSYTTEPWSRRKRDLARPFLSPLACLLPLLGMPVRAIELPGVTFAEVYLGLASFCLVAVSLNYVFVERRLKRITQQLSVSAGITVFAFACIAMYQMSGLHSQVSPRIATISFAKVAASVGWFLFAVEANWRSVILRGIFFVVSLVVFCSTCLKWVMDGFDMPFLGFTVHKNDLGLAALSTATLCLVFGISARGKVKYSFYSLAAIASTACFASASRSSFGTLMMTVMILIALLPIRRLNWMATTLFAILFASTLSIPVVYVSAQEDLGKDAQLAGREIYNGREHLWEDAINQIKNKPIIGHGKEFIFFPTVGNNESQHIHNLSLGLIYHGGVIGWLFVGFFLTAIFRAFASRIEQLEAKVGLAFFLSFVLLHELFEPSLFYLHIAYFSVWPVIGAALSLAVHRRVCLDEG